MIFEPPCSTMRLLFSSSTAASRSPARLSRSVTSAARRFAASAVADRRSDVEPGRVKATRIASAARSVDFPVCRAAAIARKGFFEAITSRWWGQSSSPSTSRAKRPGSGFLVIGHVLPVSFVLPVSLTNKLDDGGTPCYIEAQPRPASRGKPQGVGKGPGLPDGTDDVLSRRANLAIGLYKAVFV